MAWQAIIVGYSVTLVVGVPVTLACWWLLHRLVDKWHLPEGKKAADRVTWLPVTMGIVERLAFTTLVGFSVSGAASFVGAWVTIKAVGGWATWSKDDPTNYSRALFMAGLLSSGISALIGIVGGIIIAVARQP
jgi:hypothetical protein